MSRISTIVLVLLLCGGCLRANDTGQGSASPPTSPPTLPAGVPASFEADPSSEEVPTAALIPPGGRVLGSWPATTSAGDAIVVAWEIPGPDPFARDTGVVGWRRDDEATWRPVWGATFPAARTPVLGIDAQIADVTGDGPADVLITAQIGGSGACTITIVVDLAAGQQAYRSRGCDRSIVPSSDPAGLAVREAVYAPGDPHCCPSGVRESTLVYEGSGRWRTATTTIAPA